jgi:hypothetical protein
VVRVAALSQIRGALSLSWINDRRQLACRAARGTDPAESLDGFTFAYESRIDERLTTNVRFEDWSLILAGVTVIAVAILNLLLVHRYIIGIIGPSY